MPVFDPVWAVNGPTRSPTVGEEDQGFACGAADRELFNAMFQDIQQAINALDARSGKADIPVNGFQSAPPGSPAEGDRYIVLPTGTGAWAGQDNAIAMYVGGAWAFAAPVTGLQANYMAGGAYQIVYFDGANWKPYLAAIAANQPLFPEILTAGNTLALTSSVGQVVLSAGQSWQHRGLNTFSADGFSGAARTFATASSKTYHLVWDAPGTGDATPVATYPNGRLQLIDRTAVTETDPAYDTTFDRMLIARVVTDGANTPTVTSLVNKASLTLKFTSTGTPTPGAGGLYEYTASAAINWSRSPKISAMTAGISWNTISGNLEATANYPTFQLETRYAITCRVSSDWNSTVTGTGVSGIIRIAASA